MRLRVGQFTHEKILMFHPDHWIPVPLKGDRMLEQVDGQRCSTIQLQSDSAGAADRSLTCCFSQGCVSTGPIQPHCWRCQSLRCTGSFHASSRNLKISKHIWKAERFRGSSPRINYTLVHGFGNSK